ncbi:MAG: hypothetical protein QG635_966, partial [Bacteroidota bacterium]|nr:hypothetical protein [Bacteroidota bacterium]
TLTLRNQRAALPNANLKIEYEQHDIFNIATRTLAGIRADYILFKGRNVNSSVGFTWMYYDQAAIIDRVRINEEPVSNQMIGLDGKLQWDTPWMTRLLDMLPFYDTKTPSSMNVQGEWAMMLPTPNKRLSEVVSDNYEPVVYIDDFEGAQRYISLGLNPTQWSHSSQPVDSSIAFTDEDRANYRGRAFWWQRFIPYIPITDPYPNKSVVQSRTKFSPLEINFDPAIRGIYNLNPNFIDTLNPTFHQNEVVNQQWLNDNKYRIWGGMMRLFSSFNTNFDNENIEYIEIMMKVESGTDFGNSKMYIELGQISEDVIPNKALNTEDGSGSNPMPNNIIDAGEDVGIDRIDDAKEKELYPAPLNQEADPARDNYNFDFNKDDNTRADADFVKYNNFEGNASLSELGQFPDTEILNKNNGQNIFLDNSYFQYEVNLDPRAAFNPQVVGGNSEKGWALFRIPIRKPTKLVGNPLFSNIQYIRIWFKGGPVIAKIADWRLVGSMWQRISNFQSNVAPDDSVMSIAYVNREENNGAPDFYSMPPGVTPPRQLTNPDPTQDVFLNEQSLSINVKNLRYAEERMAVRIFRQMDIFYYKRLKFFLHGDGSMPDNLISGAVPKGYAFLRFGIDSSNYYEYRTPLTRGWKNVDIVLEQLTAIKSKRDNNRIYDRQEFPVPNDPDATFAIKGNPILLKVQFFGVGIANPSERFPNELTTTVWIDELRLLSPEDASDWAAVGGFNLKLADLGSLDASISHQKPNFHRLEDRFGNRVSATNWTVTMQGNLERFAPKSFTQLKIPITYTHAEIMSDPEFAASNDIKLDEAINSINNDTTLTKQQAAKLADSLKTRSQSLRVQDSWALTGVKVGLPVDFFLVTETINKMTFGYSYSQEFERSPVVAERFQWNWKLQVQYSTNFTKALEFQPWTWWTESVPLFGTYSQVKINPLPSNFSFGLNFSRSRITEQSRFLEYPSPVIREFSAQRQAQLSWKLAEKGFINPTIDYSMNTNSTLVPLEFDETGGQRTGSQIAGAMFFNNGKIIDFGDNTNHTQTITINFKPRIPDFFGITNFTDFTGNYNVTYAWSDPLQPDPKIRDIAKNASWNSSFRFTIAFKLKALADSWYGMANQKLSPQRLPSDSGATGYMTTIGRIFKTIFLDFEKIDLNFNQTNSSRNPGVYGGTGLDNFWVRGMTTRSSQVESGPSFAYQMGLISNPHGGVDVVSSNSFPFFGFQTYPGLRPPNAVLQDNYSQQTTFEAKTSRPLWEGATLDLNWRTQIGYNKNQTVLTDSNGVPSFSNIMALESLNRTYLSFPSIFGIEIFSNNVDNVIAKYNVKRAEIIANRNLDTIQKNQAMQNALGESFQEGMEAFSIFGGAIGKFLPAVNWSIRWEGLEKWDLIKKYMKRVSIEHIYQSQYQEAAQITDNGRII